MKVIVGYDGSEGSEYILNDLKTAGLPPDSDITIISATEMDPIPAEAEANVLGILEPPAGANWQRQISAEERSHLQAMLENAHRVQENHQRDLNAKAAEAEETLRAIFPRAKVSSRVVSGHAYHALAEAARGTTAHLIVVGSQKASTLARLFLGSVSQRVVVDAKRSVRIARAHRTVTSETPRIVIGFDASPESQQAVDAVAARNWPEGTLVRVVSVAEAKSLKYYVSHLLNSEALEAWFTKGNPMPAPLVQNLAETACARLREVGLRAEPLGLEGDPKQELIAMADEWNADCIFVGEKGHLASAGKTLGAVASAVASRANCSVEVVRPVVLAD